MAVTVPILASSLAATVLVVRRFPALAGSYIAVFAALTAAQFAVTAVYKLWVYPRLLSPLRHLPSPPGASWFFGHFLRFAWLPSGELQAGWIHDIPNDGLIRYFGLWNRERIMPTDAKTLQEVLHQKSYIFVKPAITRGGLAVVLGLKGILFAEGDVHRHQRKIMMPAFQHKHIKDLVTTFWSLSMYLADKIAESTRVSPDEDSEEKVNDKGKLVDMSRWTSLATLDIIGKAGFGYDFRAMETGGHGSELALVYKKIFSVTRSDKVLRILGLLLPRWFFTLLPLQRSREIRYAQAQVKSIATDLIQKKRVELAEKGEGAGDDILAVMLRSGSYDTSAESEETMRDQMMTFLAAGHETTATALAWAICDLTQHPEQQTKLRSELLAAFPSGLPTNMTYEALDSLKHLRHCCDETLRVHSPVPITMREASVDTTLANQHIPKGTVIIICPRALNTESRQWGPDALEFRPERWEKPGGGANSNYSFLTFLAGPRSCIGKEFSNVEMKALLAALVYRFEFTKTEDEIKIGGGVTARIKGGLKVWVKEIDA